MNGGWRMVLASGIGLALGLAASRPGDRVEREPRRPVPGGEGEAPARPSPPAADGSADTAQAFLARLEEGSPPASKREWARLHAAVHRLAPDELPAVVAGFPDSGHRLFHVALELWSAQDPAAAAEWMIARPGSGNSHFLEHLFLKWGRADPDAALASLGTAADSQARAAASRAIFSGLAEVDPARAIELAAPIWDEAGLVSHSRLLERLAEKDPGAAAALITGLPEGRRKIAQRSVARAWAKSNPAAAFRWSLGLTDEHVASGVVEKWAESDPEAVIAAVGAAGLTPGHARRTIQSAVNVWMKRDAGAALTFLAGSYGGDLRGEMVQGALVSLCWSDPDAVARHFESLPTELKTGGLASSLADGLANRGRALEATEILRSSGVSDAMVTSAPAIARSWPADDLGAGFDWVATLPESSSRNAAFRELVGRMSDAPLGTAKALLEQVPPSLRRAAIAEIGQAIRRSDPGGAFAWLASQGELVGLDKWIAADPAGATAYLRGLPAVDLAKIDGDDLAPLAGVDPDAALELTSRIDRPRRKKVVVDIVEGLARADPGAALGFAHRVEGEEEKASAVYLALYAWALNEPAAVAKLLADPAQDLVRERLTRTLGTSWARADPAAAAAWAESLPEGEHRRDAHAAVVSTWVSADPWAASVWIDRLPVGAERDVAVGKLVPGIAREDPASALEWALTLEAGRERERAVDSVFRAWAKADPEAARAAAAAGGLTDAERAGAEKRLGGD